MRKKFEKFSIQSKYLESKRYRGRQTNHLKHYRIGNTSQIMTGFKYNHIQWKLQFHSGTLYILRTALRIISQICHHVCQKYSDVLTTRSFTSIVLTYIFLLYRMIFKANGLFQSSLSITYDLRRCVECILAFRTLGIVKCVLKIICGIRSNFCNGTAKSRFFHASFW